MIRVEKSVVIDRGAAEVFSYVSDQTNAPRWQRGLVEVRRTTADPIGVGTRHTAVRTFMGRTLELSNEYTRYEPDRLVEFQISGSMPGQASYIVEPTGTGAARLTSRIEMEASGLLRLAEPLMAAALRRDVEAGLGTLKTLLEAQRRTIGTEPASRSNQPAAG
jgi:uncharacterized protein YndB with AHSA1/START domain